MIAALEAFAKEPCAGRRIAILGDMFELGEDSRKYHHMVFEKAMSLKFCRVIAVGEMSSECPCDIKFRNSAELHAALPSIVRPGDAVLLKASHGMKLGL